MGASTVAVFAIFGLLFAASMAQRTPQNDRIFTFTNACDEDLYIGSQGDPLPANGGFKLAMGDTISYSISGSTQAARFWARTGCFNDSNGHLNCRTGDCPLPPAGYASNDGTQCYLATTSTQVGGIPPTTVAEFTLGGGSLKISDFPDFYDLSLVDGFNVPIEVVPINGMNLSGAGRFSCGTSACANFNCSKAPPELQLRDSAGNVYACMSICIAIYNDTQRKLFPDTLGAIWNGTDPVTGHPMKDLVCCSCGKGNGGCDSPTCEYGCSPNNIPSPIELGGKCNVSKWPIASDGQRYNQVYSSQCPDAYSWQFDDRQATFQCIYPDYQQPSEEPEQKSLANAWRRISQRLYSFGFGLSVTLLVTGVNYRLLNGSGGFQSDSLLANQKLPEQTALL